MNRLVRVANHWWGATVRIDGQLVRIIVGRHIDPHVLIREYTQDRADTIREV